MHDMNNIKELSKSKIAERDLECYMPMTVTIDGKFCEYFDKRIFAAGDEYTEVNKGFYLLDRDCMIFFYQNNALPDSEGVLMVTLIQSCNHFDYPCVRVSFKSKSNIYCEVCDT